MLSSTSMVDSVTGLRYAECSRAPDYITNGHGYPMQTISCTWRQVVPIGEDPPRFKNNNKIIMQVISGNVTRKRFLTKLLLPFSGNITRQSLLLLLLLLFLNLGVGKFSKIGHGLDDS
jgi:hypothetical protein